MPEHLSRQELEQHRARTLAPAKVVRVDEHLSACDACQQRFIELTGLPDAKLQMSLSPLLDEETTPPHLAYEQLAAYVDGTIDDVERELADGHLLFCAECADEVKELREFSRQISQPPAHATVAKARPSRTARWREWLASFGPFKAAATLAALVLVVAAVLVIRRAVSQGARTQGEEIAQAPGASEPGVKPMPNDNHATIDEKGGAGRNNNEAVASANESAANANENPVPGKGARAGEAQPGSPVVALNDGAGQIGLDARGNLVGLDALSPAPRRAVRESLAQEGLKRPAALDEIAGQAGTLLDPTVEGVPFALSGPTGVVVESARPVLRWQPLGGATHYVVSIFDEDFKQTAKSDQLAVTVWRPAQPLARGRIYTWQVTALKDGREVVSPQPPAPEARFKVLEAGLSREITEARRLSPSSHLALGVIYARAGLVDQARREFQELVRRNPGSKLARRLLDSLQAWQSK